MSFVYGMFIDSDNGFGASTGTVGDLAQIAKPKLPSCIGNFDVTTRGWNRATARRVIRGARNQQLYSSNILDFIPPRPLDTADDSAHS